MLPFRDSRELQNDSALRGAHHARREFRAFSTPRSFCREISRFRRVCAVDAKLSNSNFLSTNAFSASARRIGNRSRGMHWSKEVRNHFLDDGSNSDRQRERKGANAGLRFWGRHDMNISSGSGGSIFTGLNTTFGKASIAKESGTSAAPNPADTSERMA